MSDFSYSSNGLAITEKFEGLRLTAYQDSVGVWTIQTGIFPENRASLDLHTAGGFRLVGRRERLGQLRGVWRDVLMLELRLPD